MYSRVSLGRHEANMRRVLGPHLEAMNSEVWNCPKPIRNQIQSIRASTVSHPGFNHVSIYGSMVFNVGWLSLSGLRLSEVVPSWSDLCTSSVLTCFDMFWHIPRSSQTARENHVPNSCFVKTSSPLGFVCAFSCFRVIWVDHSGVLRLRYTKWTFYGKVKPIQARSALRIISWFKSWSIVMRLDL